MSTIKIKSTELVRKFADIKAIIQETGDRVVVEEYKKPALVIFAADEEGNPVIPVSHEDIEKLTELRRKLERRKVKFSAVNLV